MLSSQMRDAAQVGLIRIKIAPGQLTPLTITFLYIQKSNDALMSLFCLVQL